MRGNSNQDILFTKDLFSIIGNSNSKQTKINKNRTYQNLWDKMKAVLSGKFIALCTYIKKKLERSYINNFITHIKSIDKLE